MQQQKYPCDRQMQGANDERKQFREEREVRIGEEEGAGSRVQRGIQRIVQAAQVDSSVFRVGVIAQGGRRCHGEQCQPGLAAKSAMGGRYLIGTLY